MHTFKGTQCLESDELVFEERLKPFVMKCIMYGLKDILEVEYNDPNTYHSKLHGFPFTSQTNTVGHFRSQILTPQNGRPGFFVT